MKLLLNIFLMIFSVTQSAKFDEPIEALWNNFKSEFQKEYNGIVHEESRMKAFMRNKRIIMEHNAKYELGLVSYKMGLNENSDMFGHEINKIMNGFERNPEDEFEGTRRFLAAEFIVPANVELPASIDWRKLGAVSPVVNQRQCGSCWAFSATGSLEGQLYRSAGYLVPLSVQNLMDCSMKYGSNGCNGGAPITAYEYVMDNGGINAERNYRYQGASDTSCRFDPKKVEAKVSGFVKIPEGDEEKLKAAVATIGPVSIAIDSRAESFKLYSEGVYDEPKCKNDLYHLDHAVLVVGYDTDKDGRDYWIVKNSYGISWGEKGYIKMIRNKKNHCGIASYAFYPIV